jgi:hypothetical protein
MQLFYKQLTNTGKITTLTFSVQKIENISSRHFIMLKRPRLNEERIASTVRNGYTKQIAEGLFSEELQKKMEKEIENAIKKEEERILFLPNPIIFVGEICELKYQGEGMQIKT